MSALAGQPQASHAPRPRPDLGWQDGALCVQADPVVFFPGKGGSSAAAKRVCRNCSVRPECLAHAIAHGEREGVWGGLSATEIRPLLKAQV